MLKNSCFLLNYYWGVPAIAYLLSLTKNKNPILNIFYPNVCAFGFNVALELDFGMYVELF
jgi:hypothetical protein